MVSTIYDDDIEFMMRIRYRYRVYIIIMMRNANPISSLISSSSLVHFHQSIVVGKVCASSASSSNGRAPRLHRGGSGINAHLVHFFVLFVAASVVRQKNECFRAPGFTATTPPPLGES